MGVFEKALIAGKALYEYIPQRPPIVMVDSYYGKDGVCSYTGLTPDDSSIFCEDGFFTESGIIEHMAQSAAVVAGVDCKSRGVEIPIGFIGAVSKLKIERLPASGTSLHSTVSEIQKFQDISLVSVLVENQGERIAYGELKIFLQNNIKFI